MVNRPVIIVTDISVSKAKMKGREELQVPTYFKMQQTNPLGFQAWE